MWFRIECLVRLAPPTSPGRSRARSVAGFTLIELIVVIAIIAALAAIVAPEMLRNTEDAKIQAARSQIEMFGLALESYRLHTDAYPTTEQGLAALRTPPTVGEVPEGWRGPYLRRTVPLDPWRRPYHYLSPGRENPQGYDIYTLGRDGTAGGDGEAGDITSWGGPVRP